jgi:ubiquinone biosynthesis protein UbiJ
LNFSPADTRTFIETSLRTLRREFPAAYDLLCAQLTPLEIHLLIEDESIPLRFRFDQAIILLAPEQPDAELRTTRQTILDVIDARLTLDEAILTDAIRLQGEVEVLQRFHDALITYVSGAVRCPSFPELLTRFREAVTS